MTATKTTSKIASSTASAAGRAGRDEPPTTTVEFLEDAGGTAQFVKPTTPVPASRGAPMLDEFGQPTGKYGPPPPTLDRSPEGRKRKIEAYRAALTKYEKTKVQLTKEAADADAAMKAHEYFSLQQKAAATKKAADLFNSFSRPPVELLTELRTLTPPDLVTVATFIRREIAFVDEQFQKSMATSITADTRAGLENRVKELRAGLAECDALILEPDYKAKLDTIKQRLHLLFMETAK